MAFRVTVLLIFLCFFSCEKTSKKTDPLAIVTVFTRQNCPISEYMCLPLRDAYRFFCDTLEQNILFQGFVPDPMASDSSIYKFQQEFDIPFSLIKDWNDNSSSSSIGGPGEYTLHYNPSVTPEVFIEFNGEIVYSGMIDDSYSSLGSQSEPTENYLFDVLMQIVNQESIIKNQTTAIGCNINY